MSSSSSSNNMPSSLSTVMNCILCETPKVVTIEIGENCDKLKLLHKENTHLRRLLQNKKEDLEKVILCHNELLDEKKGLEKDNERVTKKHNKLVDLVITLKSKLDEKESKASTTQKIERDDHVEFLRTKQFLLNAATAMQYFITTYPQFEDEASCGCFLWRTWVYDYDIIEKDNLDEIHDIVKGKEKEGKSTKCSDNTISYNSISRMVLQKIPCLLRSCMKTTIAFDKGDDEHLVALYTPIDLDTMYAIAGKPLGTTYSTLKEGISFSQVEYLESPETKKRDEEDARVMKEVFDKYESKNQKKKKTKRKRGTDSKR